MKLIALILLTFCCQRGAGGNHQATEENAASVGHRTMAMSARAIRCASFNASGSQAGPCGKVVKVKESKSYVKNQTQETLFVV